MILNRSHVPWAIIVLLITAACSVLYVANFHPQALPVKVELPSWFGPVPPVRHSYGGTPLGLIFGAAGLLIFLFAAALGIRKKRRTWPIGRVQTWLRAHIWLTILTIPLVLLHCGFRMGGTMTVTLLVLYAIVMISGFFGLAMQQFIPSVMAGSLTQEVVYEQIPRMKQRLVDAAESMRKELALATPKLEPVVVGATGEASGAAVAVEDGDQALRRFLDEECIPYLKSKRGKHSRLQVQKSADNVFRILKLGVAQNSWGKVDDLQQWCDERRQMDWQLYLHHWLHGWLLFHVPISFALLVITFWHAYVTLVYL